MFYNFIILNLKHYGIAQGHSTANLQKLASKAGTKVNSFIPPEAESPEDVRKRAISFFKVKGFNIYWLWCIWWFE